MKKFLTIILIILPVLAFSQNETGKLNNDVYNVVYTPIIPSKLTVKDGLAYFNYKTDTVVVPDSVNTRFIFLGKKSEEVIDRAKMLVDKLSRGENYDSLLLIYRANKDQEISKNYTGWFTVGKMLPEYEKFSFTQESDNYGYVETDYGVFVIEIMSRSLSQSKTNFEVPNYDFSNPFTGEIEEYYETGQLVSKSQWENGLRNGKTIEYWENGEKKIEALFKNGVKSQYYREWFNNGQIKFEELFDGEKLKSSKVWDYNGELLSESDY